MGSTVPCLRMYCREQSKQEKVPPWHDQSCMSMPRRDVNLDRWIYSWIRLDDDGPPNLTCSGEWKRDQNHCAHCASPKNMGRMATPLRGPPKGLAQTAKFPPKIGALQGGTGMLGTTQQLFECDNMWQCVLESLGYDFNIFQTLDSSKDSSNLVFLTVLQSYSVIEINGPGPSHWSHGPWPMATCFLRCTKRLVASTNGPLGVSHCRNAALINAEAPEKGHAEGNRRKPTVF